MFRIVGVVDALERLSRRREERRRVFYRAAGLKIPRDSVVPDDMRRDARDAGACGASIQSFPDIRHWTTAALDDMDAAALEPAPEMREEAGRDAGGAAALLRLCLILAGPVIDPAVRIDPGPFVAGPLSERLRKIAPGRVPVWSPINRKRATCFACGVRHILRRSRAASSRVSQRSTGGEWSGSVTCGATVIRPSATA